MDSEVEWTHVKYQLRPPDPAWASFSTFIGTPFKYMLWASLESLRYGLYYFTAFAKRMMRYQLATLRITLRAEISPSQY